MIGLVTGGGAVGFPRRLPSGRQVWHLVQQPVLDIVLMAALAEGLQSVLKDVDAFLVVFEVFGLALEHSSVQRCLFVVAVLARFFHGFELKYLPRELEALPDPASLVDFLEESRAVLDLLLELFAVLILFGPTPCLDVADHGESSLELHLFEELRDFAGSFVHVIKVPRLLLLVESRMGSYVHVLQQLLHVLVYLDIEFKHQRVGPQ